MIVTVGELISQIRNLSKAVKQDNIYISDRLIYSLIKKHLALFIYREDANMKVIKARFIYSSLSYIPLKEVDAVEANCSGLKSGCIIKRTKDKLPPMMKGYNMPLIGDVTSLDGSEKIIRTAPFQYVRKSVSTDFKYNTTKYYWYLNGYLYFPNLQWDAIRLEAVLDGEGVTDCGEIDECAMAQDNPLSAPENLLSVVQDAVLKDIMFLIQSPADPTADKQSNER